MRRVLVTRPEPAASRTAKRLAALGFEPVVLPLTEIAPLDPGEWPKDVANFDVVAITSANAVRHAPAGLLKQLEHLPAYAVGERTGEAAQAAGLSVSDASAGDAAALAARLKQAVSPGGRVLLLCGRVRRETLERALGQAGIVVAPIETYDTVKATLPDRELPVRLGNAPIDAVLLYSAVAAEVFAALLADPLAAPFFAQSTCFAISGRVAEVLPSQMRERARVAREPTEEAMLSMQTDGA
jgi:uroporphyrinogen-III synthase